MKVSKLDSHKMRIAIDNGPLKSGHKIRGVGMYTRELIKALGSNVEAVDFSKADLGKYDVIHYPYFGIFTNILPFPKPTKTVITIHDLVPLIYSKHYPPGLRGSLRLLEKRLLLGGVDAIITDTETSKKDIVRFLGVKPEMVHVVYLAPKEIFRKLTDKRLLTAAKKKYKLPDRFVLYIGDVNYNKNIPNLIAACKIAKLPLVICGKQALDVEDLGNDLRALKGPRDWVRFLFGKPHPELAHYKEILKAFNRDKNVMRLGFVLDADLVAIYNLATLYCQPSLYEGFGLPVLEALACGTPVVAAKTQALVEIAEGAARFVDPYDPKDIAKGFKNLVRSPRLASRQAKLPRDYSWDKVAQETLAVYAQI